MYIKVKATKMLLIVRCFVNAAMKQSSRFLIGIRGRIVIQEKFGERVRTLRKLKKLSQENFSLLINMDRTYLASVEAGRRNISIMNIEKIASGLDVSISELFIGL